MSQVREPEANYDEAKEPEDLETVVSQGIDKQKMLYESGPVEGKIGIRHNIYHTWRGPRTTWGVRALLLDSKKKRTLRGKRPYMIIQGIETMELAAETNDRAVIAVVGREKATTNYPLSMYPRDVKRDGMDVEEFLLHLWNVAVSERPNFRWKDKSNEAEDDVEPLEPEPRPNALDLVRAHDSKAHAQACLHQKVRGRKLKRRLYRKKRSRRQWPGKGVRSVSCGFCENCLLEAGPCLKVVRAGTARRGARTRLQLRGSTGRSRSALASALARRHTELFREQEEQREAKRANPGLSAGKAIWEAHVPTYPYGQEADHQHWLLARDNDDYLGEVVDIVRTQHGMGSTRQCTAETSQSTESIARCIWCHSARHLLTACPLQVYGREELMWQPHTLKGIQGQLLAYEPTSDHMKQLLQLEPHEQVVAAEVAESFLTRSSLLSFTLTRNVGAPPSAVIAVTSLLKEMARCSL